MSPAEIAETFIRAAEIERLMPNTGEKPRQFGGYALPWIRTFEDKLNWRKEIGDSLHRGDDPLSEERQAFTDGRSAKVTAEDVSLWERCIRWTTELLDDPRERRSLWAWAFAKAGGKPFAKWCRRIEHIHEETGRRRKDRAVMRISAQLARSDVQNIENGHLGVLPVGADFGDSDDILGGDVGRREGGNAWAADGAFTRLFTEDTDFSWAEKRNKLRREREAKRRQHEAA